ncbi:MAG: DUF4352 domain-containing protein [Chloroflexi bacterium]|nr:DUF4352 domain-containing protein [Chloroflexota bacterium]
MSETTPPPPSGVAEVERQEKRQIRREYLLVGVLAIVAVCCMCAGLLALGGNNNRANNPGPGQAVNAENPAPTAVPELPPTPTSPAAAVGASLENPASVGMPVEVPLFRFTVLSAERPADARLASYSPWNVAPEDQEFQGVRVRVECISEQECNFAVWQMDLIGSSGVIYAPRVVLVDVPDLAESREMLPGSSFEGSIYYEVPRSEGSVTLRWEPIVGNSVYMRVP